MSAAGKLHNCECGKPRTYSYAFDAFYCEACDQFLDKVCENRICIFCKGRKEKPSQNNLCKAKGQR